MTTKHKHYDLIVAWAGGAEIEYRYWGEWRVNKSPGWSPEVEYRIKPKPKVKKYRWVIESKIHGMFVSNGRYSNVSNLEKENPGMRAVIHIPETMIEVEES